MNYVIDETIVFDSENGTLSQTADPSRTNVLPKPAVLLLEVFVNNPGVIMSRNSLMEAAWLDAGLTLSGHNLSTYIKVIRHNLAELEVEKEYIKTLPRVGVMMVVDVVEQQKVLQEKIQQEEVLPEEVIPAISATEEPVQTIEQSVPDAEENITAPPPKKMRIFPFYLLVLCILFIIIQIFWPVTPPLSFTPSNERLKKITSIGKCDVLVLDNTSVAALPYIDSTLKRPEITTPCAAEAHYIFFNSLDLKKIKKNTAAICRYNPVSHAPEDCTTYSWEYEE